MVAERRAADPSLDEARAALRELFGHADFREGQEDVVRAILGGDDVLAIMPTGAGKSLCYQLAGLLLDGCTLIISPLLALMKDQVDGLPPAVHERTALFSSLVDRDTLAERQAGLLAGRYKLVYATPERLRQRPFVDALKRAGCSLVVVDEAHCVSLWGHDFRPDYLFVRRALDLLGQPRLLAMTATATPAIQRELSERFGRPLTTVATGVLRPNLRLEVRMLSDREAKLRALVEICQRERGSGIIYVTSREQAEDVAMLLRRRGVTAGHYHAGMPRDTRAAAQEGFMLDRVRVMVATTAFGMGVDKANVRFVVHLSPPRSLEAYVQESGRAGRDRRPARCVLLASRGDRATLRRWVKDDLLEVSLLRRVFAEVRRAADGGIAAIAADDLTRRAVGDAAEESGETRVRVALGLLEQVGLLRRHLDVPRWLRLEMPAISTNGSADGTLAAGDAARWGAVDDTPSDDELTRTLAGTPADHAEFARVAAALGLRPGRSIGGHPRDLARRAGVPAEELEGLALGWQSEGLVRVEHSGRLLLLELLPAPSDAAARVQKALDAWEQAQTRRIDALLAYVDSHRCRHRVIAAHFQVSAPDTCDACDICRPVGDEDSSESVAVRPVDDARSPDDPVRTLLSCIGGLPFAVGKRKLALIVKGSVQAPIGPDRCPEYGELGSMAIGAIEREIDGLLASGLLARAEGDFPVLALTAAGRARLAEPPRAPTTKPRAPIPSRSSISGPANSGLAGQPGPVQPGADATTTPSSGRSGSALARLPGVSWDDEADDGDEAEAERRFERLRAWNRLQAASEGVPAYCVFSLATLREIARRRPADRAALARVPGIGPAKLERYGALVVELLAEPPDA